MSWRDRAACQGMPTDLFYQPDNSRGMSREYREHRAKAVCRSCPTVTQCLAYALEHREYYGVWGGTTEDERARIFGRAIGGKKPKPAVRAAMDEPVTT